MISKLLAFLLWLSIAEVAFCAPPPVTCPAGSPLGSIDLKVVIYGKQVGLPLQTINRLTEGDTITYAPILRPNEKRMGEVSLVLAPTLPTAQDHGIIVLEPRPANRPTQWKVPRKISVAVFVYGPEGLNRGKVQTMLAKNSDLVEQLADYAQKTSQTEALIQALTQPASSSDAATAALQGFASQYGVGAKLDKTAPADEQAMVLFRTLNPTLQTADPLASQTSQRFGETASIATSIAGMFFGSPVGLAAGGTAMLMELRAMAFPRTDFRSSLAQPVPDKGLALCGKTQPAAVHTKIAFLWATRIPNVDAPQIEIGKANSIPAGEKSPLPIELAATDWQYIDRIRQWQLVGDDQKPIDIRVTKLVEDKSIELDLRKVKLNTGSYKLQAHWDWQLFPVKGDIHLQHLGDFHAAHVDPLSQDQLIAGKGKVRAALTGGDFEFVTAVEFQKLDDEFSKPEPIPYVLPDGLRRGPQEHLDLLVDTSTLEPGKYAFFLKQVDSNVRQVSFRILPHPPSISNLPIVISRGDAVREVTLKGEHLDLLTKIDSGKAVVTLGPALPQQSERTATFQVREDLKPGTAYDIRAFVSGHSEPIVLAKALHVVGPRPVISSARLSAPQGMAIPLESGELAAGVFVTGVLNVQNLTNSSAAELSCEGQEGNVVTLKMGQHTSTTTLEQMAPDQLFLSFDTNGWPTGCTIQVRVDNGPDGQSDACKLGRLVRFPHVDSFRIISGETATLTYVAELIGTDLQNIAQVGWDANNGNPVSDLPAPIPGAGVQQSLSVAMPAAQPSPHAPLYVWLRGDQQGRLTSIHD